MLFRALIQLKIKVGKDNKLDIFLVGGAVRDELLGKPIKERDWVVVGATPEDMIKQGYQPVGKDFPVFLHPKTHEEYALARTERKTAKGYKGFHFYATPDVSLTEDLIRRDLTINAMAKNMTTGEIIDPYHGQADLKQKIFRHVSEAFSEDPVRILRVARFASTFSDFSVDPATNQLMQQMVRSGEVNALVAERVWKEFSRALACTHPKRFFDVLQACHALPVLFPELNDMCFSVFENATRMSQDNTIRFAALLHHLPFEKVQSLCKRYRVPSEFAELATLAAKHHRAYHDLNVKEAEAILALLKSVDAFRRPERFTDWITTCQAIDEKIHHRELLLRALAAAKSVDMSLLLAEKLEGKAFADRLSVMQRDAIAMAIYQ